MPSMAFVSRGLMGNCCPMIEGDWLVGTMGLNGLVSKTTLLGSCEAGVAWGGRDVWGGWNGWGVPEPLHRPSGVHVVPAGHLEQAGPGWYMGVPWTLPAWP